MHAVVLHRNTCSPMRRLHRARSNRSNPRLVRIKLVTATYAYDNNGNLTSAGSRVQVDDLVLLRRRNACGDACDKIAVRINEGEAIAAFQVLERHSLDQ